MPEDVHAAYDFLREGFTGQRIGAQRTTGFRAMR